ncbi:ketopantoate reductase family protein [Pedobacter sp. Hv1]|uniref:ketopantoate reductase family protein n=1 Tax=Pedobacter sp. Hv1 TaxID=1740090 RepID=UPI0013793693|nr:2-dehydropantoate 2-reductase [Pedobacter sp. Hv1]
MADQTKIVIAGIGGVGGYFGGLLAKTYQNSKEVAIHFIARGAHLKHIQEHGLKVIKGEDFFIAKPHLATNDPNEVGIANYIIVCTKNYDLEEILDQLKPCIDRQTVIIPLLNGVEAVEKIKTHLPNNLVAYGCAYIVSVLQEPGIIANMGNRQEIHFGLDHADDERLVQLEKLLTAANIQATYAQNILPVVWEKFIFLSCIATATSYFDKSVGQLLAEDRNTLTTLLDEVTALALKKEIKVDPEIKAKAMAHYETLPYDATSSMHRDFSHQKSKTELSSLTGYVVKESDALGLAIPLFRQAYQQLLKK